MTVAENSHLYADEQNGFRKKRSCIDHIFTMSSIIRNRKNRNLPTYIAFVDLEKAFDRVDRNLLLYKLKSMGFGGKMFNIIQSLYSNCQACVNVNGHLTNFFPSEYGVRQGDALSPTLFGLFINDLAHDLRACNSGIWAGDFFLCSLFYADDLALISDSEEKLQEMISTLYTWCRKWRMRVNVTKTKIVHFRVKSQTKSTYKFMYGTDEIEIVDKYKYLGIILDEYLDFDTTSSVLAGSGGRALGAVYSKFCKLKGLGYRTYTKMYEAGVIPILDYCSGVWGFKSFGKINTIQNRAIRFFLGVHSFAPNLAINGDMGWVSCHIRRKIEMIRFWNRMIALEDNRLTKKIFMWDTEIRKQNWSSEIYKIFQEINQEQHYNGMTPVDIKSARQKLCDLENNAWRETVVTTPKLRTYTRYKFEYSTEPYVHNVFNRGHRSILAQFRSGILPLKVETGRFTNIPVEFRLCIFCEENVVEDEEHFLFGCSFYRDERRVFFNNVSESCLDFYNLSSDDKFNVLMKADIVKQTAAFLYCSYIKRRDMLYN